MDKAVHAVEVMERRGIPISVNIVLCLLQGCSGKKDLATIMRVQSLMVRTGLDSVALLDDHLIRLFASYGRLLEANQVFCKVAEPSVYTWSAIISANAKLGQAGRALELYHKMLQSSVKSDKYVYIAVLKACAKIGHLTQGRLIHSQIVECELISDVAIGSSLVDMYAKCGSIEEAQKVFDKLPNQNVVSWGAMIAGYALHGCGFPALKLFQKMQLEGIEPDRVTFLSALKACGSIGTIEQGRLIHEQIIQSGFELDVAIGNALVDMYAKCGNIEEARKVFDKLPNRNVISWATMITRYVLNGNARLSLELFQKMQQVGIEPDRVAFLSILKACGSIGAIEQGRLIHNQIIQSGLALDVVIGNALIDMYAKCGSLGEAHKVFNELPNRDVVSWGAMIAGYALHGHALPALELFQKMPQDGIDPNEIVFSSTLKACGSIGAIDQGRLIHDQIIQGGFELDVAVGNALVDMYAKCGDIEEACKVFDELPNKDVVSWGAMIAGYARCGNCRLAFQCLEDMQRQGLEPVDVIFISILAACSHAGLVDEGQRYFKSMREDYGITPGSEHYACMVDLLGRAGLLNEAEDLLQTMQPDIIGWRSLLTACRTYGNVELGRRCFEQIIQLAPNHAAGYVLMSNIYSNACMWKDAEEIEKLRKVAGAWKKPGKAWIEVNNKVHEFIVGDKSHPQRDEIDAKLKMLSRQMKDNGYMPQLDLVLKPMPDKDKEDALCGHCEKLAIAFGLVSTPRDKIIRATKNLRVCMDCHNATKVISEIEKREIIIRDAYRIHHFKYGECSCGDYF